MDSRWKPESLDASRLVMMLSQNGEREHHLHQLLDGIKNRAFHLEDGNNVYVTFGLPFLSFSLECLPCIWIGFVSARLRESRS